MFYLKLAKANLQKNRQAYVPFLGAMVFLVIINSIMQVILHNEGMQKLPKAMSAMTIFNLGSYILLIFSIIFGVYAHSFLLKQRKKELGLYNILGLGKGALSQVLFWETFCSYILVISVGFILSIVFTKLSFLLLKKMTGLGISFVYQFQLKSVWFLMLFFAGLFLLLFFLSLFQLRRINPIDLLKGGQHGEKEPKTKWVIGILGVLCIVIGYGISVSIKSPIEAMTQFYLAVILVIVGTYCLFTASSIVLLKMLKKNKKFYYQPNHFITISSMMYRMKQNAAGLASICVLSTMVLVTLAITASLFFGSESILSNRNPFDLGAGVSEQEELVGGKLQELAKEYQVEITESNQVKMSPSFMMVKEPGSVTPILGQEEIMIKMDQLSAMVLMSAAEYSQLIGKQLTLENGQILLYDSEDDYPENTLQLASQNYQVKQKIDEVPNFLLLDGITSTFLIVMASDELVLATLEELAPNNEADFYNIETTVFVNYQGEKANRLAYSYAFEEYLKEQGLSYKLTSKDIDREEMKLLMGGFLFLGLIFGLTFTLATGLIIYYKQISEGRQDEVRFDIMQRVGMSHLEVRKIIRGQILAVFFFPIGLASLHLAFAFPIIQKLLMLFGLSDVTLFFLVSVCVVFIFCFVYFLLFWQTSKAYFRIVERKQGIAQMNE